VLRILTKSKTFKVLITLKLIILIPSLHFIILVITSFVFSCFNFIAHAHVHNTTPPQTLQPFKLCLLILKGFKVTLPGKAHLYTYSFILVLAYSSFLRYSAIYCLLMYRHTCFNIQYRFRSMECSSTSIVQYESIIKNL